MEWYEREVKGIEDALRLLRLARRFNRESSAALAKRLGIHRATLLRYEAGDIKSSKIIKQNEEYIISYVKDAQARAREFFMSLAT